MDGHGEITFSLGFYILQALYLLIALGALAIIIDAMRAKRSAKRAELRAAGRHIEPLWIYQILAGIYLAFFLLIQFDVFSGKVGYITGGVAYALILEVAYLLRVVFPKPLKQSPTLSPEEQITHDRH